MTNPTRRNFLTTTATLAAVGGSVTLAGCDTPAQFHFGVASGDPLTDRVILWTHAARPNQTGDVRLTWQVAKDAAFKTIVSSGKVIATKAAGIPPRQLADALAHALQDDALVLFIE